MSSEITPIVRSFGAIHTILSFYNQLDVLKLQVVCKYFYNVGISRVQMRIYLVRKDLVTRKVYFLLR